MNQANQFNQAMAMSGQAVVTGGLQPGKQLTVMDEIKGQLCGVISRFESIQKRQADLVVRSCGSICTDRPSQPAPPNQVAAPPSSIADELRGLLAVLDRRATDLFELTANLEHFL